MESFREHLTESGFGIVGEFSRRHGVLKIPASSRRFWTPCLDLTIEAIVSEDTNRQSARLRGTFSPQPEIWTALVFSIGTLVIVSIFATMYGVAQWALGDWPRALLVPFGAMALAGALYGVALIGQGLSIGDMYRLRAFVDECLRDAERKLANRPQTARESAQL